MRFQVGSKIRISTLHWARAGAAGTIVEYDPKRKVSARYLVRFDEPGIGFDHGYYLWMEGGSLVEMDD